MFRIAVIALLTSTSLLGCAAEPVTGPVPLRVAAVPNIALAIPLIGLAENRQLSDRIRSSEVIPVNSPDEIRAMLTSSRADIATMPITVATTLANGGLDVRLLGVVDGALLKVVGPGNAGWDSLRGQTVHLPFRGDFAELIFTRLAAANGLTPGRDFTISYASALTELVTAMSTGRARFAVLPEHFATLAVRGASAAGHRTGDLLDLRDEWSRITGSSSLPASALVIRGELAHQQPELVGALRTHFTVATAAAATDTVTAAAAVGAQTRMPIALAAELLPRLQTRFIPAGQARPDIETLLTHLIEIEPLSVGGRLPDAVFYD